MVNVDKNKRVKVINRTDGSLAYHIESLRQTRHWRRTGDHLNISIGELLELKTSPGGTAILKDSVLIEDKEALEILFPYEEIQPEYNYGEKEVEQLLYEADTAQLLDALDYAPKGVLELIRRKASQKLPDTTDKIAAINKKFEIDLNTIHALDTEKDIQEEKRETVKKRRTVPLGAEKETNENKAESNYKVVNRD